MKILQINNNFYKSGGTETVFINTIKLLQEHGHNLSVLALNNPQNHHLSNAEYFIESKNFLHNSLYSFHSKKVLLKIINSERPDIVHLHNLVGGISLSILPLLRKKKIPVVSTIHNFRYLCPAYIFIDGNGEICEKCGGGNFYFSTLNKCSPEGLSRSFLLMIESYFRNALLPYRKYIDKFLFVSKFTEDKFIQYYPEIKLKSSQLYNFVNNISSMREGKKKDNYFLYVGRLDREKGIITLLKAFNKLNEIKLLIVGDGPLKNFIMENKTSNVSYVGFKKGIELSNLMGNASFIIIPSECYENNPMVILEAYSKGVPVIGSNLGGIPEIILNGKTGFLFKPGDHKDLMSIISKAKNLNENEYSNFSIESLNFAKQYFESEKHYSKLIEIYSDTIGNYN